MKIFKKLAGRLLALVITANGGLVAADAAAPKILMVISSNGADAGATAPGYEFDEFSAAYLVFKANDIAVDVASPAGGANVADRFDPDAPINRILLEDAAAMAKLESSLPLSGLKADAYDAVFIVGGKGAMFDLPVNEPLQALVREIYEAGGVVSAVCHGPAALVDVTLSDGRYLVEGRAVNGFTNVEERLFGKTWLKDYAFLLEDKLIERGGYFQASPMMLSHVAVDGRLITGQNPASTHQTAEAVVRKLGIEPAFRQKYEEERTLDLVAALLKGDTSALDAFAADPEAFNGPLLAMYGYYYAEAAETPMDHQRAITLMSLETPVRDNPRLRLQVAESWAALQAFDKARDVAQTILETDPDFEGAKRFLAGLD